MGEKISQIPNVLAAEPALADLLELELGATGQSVRMEARWLPGRSNNSLPAARLQASVTDVLFGRSSAGGGAGEEVPCTSVGRQLLAVANIPAAQLALNLEPGVDVQEWDSFLQALADAADAASVRALIGVSIGVDVQAQDAELAALAALVSAADKVPYFTGSGTAALADLTAAGRAVIGAADAAAQRAALGLVIGADVQAQDAELAALAALVSAADKVPYFTGSGTAALADLTAFARTLLDDANAAAARTTLGLVIGTDVQAQDTELAALAALVSAADKLPYFTGSGTAALADLTSFARTLLDDASSSTARTTLGLQIGLNVQAWDLLLDVLATLNPAADKFAYFTGASSGALATLTSFARTLLDDADAATARATLGLNNQVTKEVAYTFTTTAAGYSSEQMTPIFRAPFAMTIVAAYLISGKASSGSGAGTYWQSEIKNATASNSLCSSPWTSNGSELTAGAAKDLGANQNLSIAAGDVLVGTMLSVGAPTSMQHSPWTWVIVGTPT